MWHVPTALLLCLAHAAATAITILIGPATTRGIVDVGHAAMTRVFGGSCCPGLEPWVTVLTAAAPVVVLTTPHPALTVARAVRLWCLLWAMRCACVCLTVLPALAGSVPARSVTARALLFGTGYDFVFSGHASFVAAWVLAAGVRGRLAATCAVVHGALIVAARMHYSVDVAVAWFLAAALAGTGTQAALGTRKFSIRYLDPKDATQIQRLRQAVYADELRQCARAAPENAPVIIAAYAPGGPVAGYVALTPPGSPKRTPCLRGFDNAFELRALTVARPYRGQGLATALLLAAGRYVQLADGENTIVAAARKEVVPFYRRLGFKPAGEQFTRGRVQYVPGRIIVSPDGALAQRLASTMTRVQWDLPYPPTPPAMCMHGLGSTDATDPTDVVHADVLDAWYSPSPAVLKAVQEGASNPWYLRTTPPLVPGQLVDAIAARSGVRPENILMGAGSSDLMYRAFGMWLTPDSRVLLLVPTYGEYPHIFEKVIGCCVDRLDIRGMESAAIACCLAARGPDYDCVVLVNPNSPLGRFVPGLGEVLVGLPPSTRVWIDETYVDYVPGASLEVLAAGSNNLVVCKSMSKVFALSGLRVAYLCGSRLQIQALRAVTPPWILGRLTLKAALAALSPDSHVYYQARIEETCVLRRELTEDLEAIGMVVEPGACANFLVCTPPPGTAVDALVLALKRLGVYVRDANGVPGMIRIAVRSRLENKKLCRALQASLK